MAKIEKVQVYGLEESFVASGFSRLSRKPADYSEPFSEQHTKRVGRLSKTAIGSGHDNFLNGIVVQFDLTFSTKAWIELQRYHFIDFVSSQSTIQCLREMDIVTYCNEYVDPEIRRILEEKVKQYKEAKTQENFYQMIYNIPSGFELMARLSTNYRQLKTIYHQRRNHVLKDWQVFCDWVETLPYSFLITGKKEDSK